uniref:Serine incorporator 3 n=1 Tax=Glycine max TaxID=3847 RepID=K7MAP9_SOYBN
MSCCLSCCASLTCEKLEHPFWRNSLVFSILSLKLSIFILIFLWGICLHHGSELGKFHHGGWTAKIVIWLLLVVLAFFLPDAVILVYGIFIAKFGAGLFLLIQVIILLDFTHTWNDAWVEKDEQKWYIALLAVSVGCYIAAFTGSGILFFWFNPSGYDCSLNIFFFVMTMILAFVFAIIALHPQVNGSLLPSAVISLYCAYCNGLNKSRAVSTSTLVLGMLTTVLSVLYSALRAGYKPLLEEAEEGKAKEEKEAQPVIYSYSFFHQIFALASMYSAMLLSGWTSTSES